MKRDRKCKNLLCATLCLKAEPSPRIGTLNLLLQCTDAAINLQLTYRVECDGMLLYISPRALYIQLYIGRH